MSERKNISPPPGPPPQLSSLLFMRPRLKVATGAATFAAYPRWRRPMQAPGGWAPASHLQLPRPAAIKVS